MRWLARYRIALVLLVILPMSGCLFRSRKVPVRAALANLLTATREQLVARINSEAAKIHSLNATVDIDTSVGGSTKGKITEYQEIRGYILLRQPDMLRMIGLMPIVRTRAFDMVSDGNEFKLWIPPKNRFVIGRNDVINPSATQPLENLRPQHIMDALLLHEIDPQNEIAVLENGTETVTDPRTKKQIEQPDYIIDVIRRGEQGWFLSRKIVFNRTDLQPDRQIVYDKNGWVATDARYEDFKNSEGVLFPYQIQIWRPQEEYSIVLNFVKTTFNQPLTDQQFALTQPPGSQLIRLDGSSQATTGPPGQK